MLEVEPPDLYEYIELEEAEEAPVVQSTDGGVADSLKFELKKIFVYSWFSQGRASQGHESVSGQMR